MSKKIEKNVFGYFGILIVWTIPIFFIILLIQNIITETFVLLNFAAAISVTILFSLPSFLVTASVLQQYSTEITDIGITRKYLGGTTTLLWSEVKDIQIAPFKLTLKTSKKSHLINLVFYKHPDEIVDYIKKQIEISKTNKPLV
jgi:hypothetical protein